MPKRRLKNLEDVRRFLASIIRSVESKEIDPVVGGKLAYISSILIRAIEGSELETRVAALERAQSKR
jgi:hypothetical protein